MPLLLPMGFFRSLSAADVYDLRLAGGSAATLTGAGFTFARTSTAWDDTLTSYGSGVPVMTAARGLYVQGTRTNLFLSSTAPVTQTIAAMATGTYILWLTGSGSVTVSGGATGTATAAAPLTFTLTGPVSCAFAVSGTVTYVSVELGTVPTLPIVTGAGASVTRNSDGCAAPRSAITTGTVAIWGRTPKGGSTTVQNAWCADDGTAANQWRVVRNTSGVINLTRTSASVGSSIAAGSAPDDTDICLVIAFAGGDVALRTSLGGSATGSPTSPATAPTVERIGSSSGPSNWWNASINRIARWSTRLPNPDLDTLAAVFR